MGTSLIDAHWDSQVYQLQSPPSSGHAIQADLSIEGKGHVRLHSIDFPQKDLMELPMTFSPCSQAGFPLAAPSTKGPGWHHTWIEG